MFPLPQWSSSSSFWMDSLLQGFISIKLTSKVNNPTFWSCNTRGNIMKWIYSVWGFLLLFLFCHFPDPSHQEIRNHSVRVPMGMDLTQSKSLSIVFPFALVSYAYPSKSISFIKVPANEIYILVQDKLFNIQHFSPWFKWKELLSSNITPNITGSDHGML